MVPATEFVIPPIVGMPRTLMRGRNPGEAKTTFSLSIWERAGVRVKAGIQGGTGGANHTRTLPQTCAPILIPSYAGGNQRRL